MVQEPATTPQEPLPAHKSHSDTAATPAPAKTDARGPGSGSGERLAIGLGFDRLAKMLVWWTHNSTVEPHQIEAWTGETEATLRQWDVIFERDGLAGLAGIDRANLMPGGFDPLRYEESRILAHWESTLTAAALATTYGGGAGGN